MHDRMPRAMALHDLAGYGRCSLTVILPVLSVLGVQACPVPTAVLSAHSGYPDFSFHDLTGVMVDFKNHWQAMNLDFDCIYSGFLGSVEQIDIVLAFIREFKQDGGPMVMVDPVMGDDGLRYRTYTDAMQARMKELVAHADIITPNLTEACFLLDEPYPGEVVSPSMARGFVERLSALGPKQVVLTGARENASDGYNLAFDATQGQFWQVGYELVPTGYPGTGDLFASVLLGLLLKGQALRQALEVATRYLRMTVSHTHERGTPPLDGVLFEDTLRFLVREDLMA